MEELYKNLKEKILKEHPDTIAIIVHGSSLVKGLIDYSDLDFNIFLNGKVDNVIENEIILFEGKRILINLNFENSDDAIKSIEKESNLDKIMLYFVGYNEINTIYDKTGFIPKLLKKVKERNRDIKDKQTQILNIKFKVLIDFYFKLKRSKIRNDEISIIKSARHIGNSGIGIIQYFNNSEGNLYFNRILLNYDSINKFKIFPKHFKYDLRICWGLKSASINQIYNSGERLTKELIFFLSKKKMRNIKDKNFHKLLNQSNKLFVKIK